MQRAKSQQPQVALLYQTWLCFPSFFRVSPLGNTLSCMVSVGIYRSWISADSGTWHISQGDMLTLLVPASLVCRHQPSEALGLGTLMENLLSTRPVPLLLSLEDGTSGIRLFDMHYFFLGPSCFSSTPHFFSSQS